MCCQLVTVSPGEVQAEVGRGDVAAGSSPEEQLAAYARRIGWRSLAREAVAAFARSHGGEAGGRPQQRRQQDVRALLGALRGFQQEREGAEAEPKLRILWQTRELMQRVQQVADWH